MRFDHKEVDICQQSDYASIKNGSYGKLVKAYYAKQKADSVSSGRDSSAKRTSMGSAAGTLAKSAGALMKDLLWEKKQIKTKDEKTGEETTKEDYDWDAIKKADISTLKSVFTGYNSFASKVYDKAQSMTNAAARAGGTYTSTGNYSDVLSSILPSNIDKKE
jgi:hypothetical protein